MTTNSTITETYERSDHDFPATRVAGLPKLFWAGSLLFACNAAIALTMWISPELRVDMYGAEVDRAISTFKPSPFTEVVSTAAPRKVRTAERIRPVLFQPDPAYVDYAMASMEQSMPRATQQASYASGGDAHAVVERMSEMPRMTASLDLPRHSARTIHTGTVEVAPRQVSERARPILNN